MTVTHQRLTGAEILRQVGELGPLVESEADEVVNSGKLTPKITEALRQAGVFAMLFPAELGGPAVRPDDQVRVIERLAVHDASVAWSAMILADGGFYAAKLDPVTANEIYPRLDLATSATGFPLGRATAIGDGNYRISGRWTFASGVDNADRSIAGFARFDEHGVPELGPDGKPLMYWAWVPREAIEIHDTWRSTGLNGTGSASFSVEEAVIPATHFVQSESSELAGLPPIAQSDVFQVIKAVGVPLGIARRGLDEFYSYTTNHRANGADMSGDPQTAVAAARAESLFAAARSLVYSAATDLSDHVWSGSMITPRQEGLAFGMLPVVAELCREVLEIVMAEVGSRAVLAANPFDRLYRDMSTLIRHGGFRRYFSRRAGELLLRAAREGT